MNERAPMCFGLLGGFAGDAEKLARATRLADALRGPRCDQVSVEQIIEVLEQLPFSGRIELVLGALCQSPARDRLVRALFDACFVEHEADGASAQRAMLESLQGSSARVLAPERFSVIRLIVVALPQLGRLGVELFHRYQQSSSTALFPAFLAAMVASRDFSDDELEAVYVGAVDASQRAILEQCKRAPHRAKLVARLIERELAPLSMLYWADPAFVDAQLSRGTPAQIAAIESQGFRNWPQLGAVYLAHLRRAFEANANDPLGKGRALRAFESRSVSPSSAHVVALVALCEEHQPLELAPTVGAAVRAHLEETSRRGAWAGPYAEVALALPCDALLNHLHAEDRVALLRANLVKEPRGLRFTESHRRLCETLLARRAARRSAQVQFAELVREVFGAISEEALWELRTGTGARDGVHSTFDSVLRFVDRARWNDNRLALAVLESWLALHARSAPSPAVIARYEGRKSARELSTLWLRSALGLVMRHASAACARSMRSLDRCSPRAARSCVTSYVRYATILCDDVRAVLRRSELQCDPTLRLALAAELAEGARPLFDRAASELDPRASTVASQTVDALRAVIESALIEALEAASDALVFDPAREGYVSAAQHGQLAPALSRACHPQNLAHFAALGPALLALCDALIERGKVRPEAARLGFVESINRAQQKTFVFFDLEAHKLWSSTALSLLTALQSACNARTRDRDEALCARVWALYKREKFGAKLPKRSEKKFAEYLTECAALAPSVLAQEKSALIDAGVALCQSDELAPVAALFARLGWLGEILDRASPASAVRDRLLLAHGAVSVPAVRVLLEDATTDRDAATRMQAHVTLLSRSEHALDAVAESLAYVARRIRNEAGLYRPQVYQWITERIAAIVTRSLERAHDSEAAALESIGVLCESLEKMLRDDVSKRDTVAKNAFRAIAATVLSTALLFDGGRPCVEARRRWVHCAVLLDWIVVRALHGEDGARSFVWPLQGRAMPLDRTVPEAWLQAYLPFLHEHARAGQNRFDELRVQMYSAKHAREASASPRFSVAQAVTLLIDALRAAQTAPGAPLAKDELGDAKGFAPSPDDDSPLLRRARALFAFAGAQWRDAPALLQFFERMIASLDAPKLEASQLRQSIALFEAVCAGYPQGAPWYEVAPLARACERLFRAAIARGLADESRWLYPRWRALRLGLGRTPIARELTDPQAQYLLARGALREADVRESASGAARRCETARALLELTPSGAYLCADELVALRDDRLLEHTWKTRGALRGVFDPEPKADPNARAPIAVSSEVWPTLDSRAMRTYTAAALEAALDVSRSPQSRSNAVSEYVRSPASSHVEVIELLRRLLQLAPAQRDQDAQRATDAQPAAGGDDARELLLETVILSATQTDAAWFVLSFLLSPEVIATSQRTTASLLTNLHAWVAMDKVVAVLQILLEPARRWAIQLYLHKAIVRMLLETPTARARALFANEWAQRDALKLHADVRHEMVKLAVAALASTDEAKATLGWAIADEVARTHEAFETTTVLLLLTPIWTPAAPFAGHRLIYPLLRVPVTNTEVPESFGLLHAKWLAEAPLHVTETSVRDRLRAMLAPLEESPKPYVRTLATCVRWTLSPCAAGEHDAESLARLQSRLRALSVHWSADPAAPFPEPGATERARTAAYEPHEEFMLQVAPRLLAALALQVLHNALLQHTEHERQTGRALSEECQRHPAARALRDTFGECLAALATIAPIHQEKRRRVASVAQGVLGLANEWASAKPLLTQHFQEALRFLRADLERVTPLL